jgi:putative ABC transport system permease protein
MGKSKKTRDTDMPRFLLFYRLMVRPLLREPVRTALTIAAIALGVAVVLAIDLASGAAAGSFHSSLDTLSGDSNLEVTASGGVPEKFVAALTALPFPIRVSSRIEDYVVVTDSQQTLPLIGLDFVAEMSNRANNSSTVEISKLDEALKYVTESDSIWVGESLGRKAGDHLQLLVNDQVSTFTVRGFYPDRRGEAAAVVMDLATAQRALNRFGRVDRILLKLPQSPDLLDAWQQRVRAALPGGLEVRPAGSGTNENRRMLAAFRWNLRLLSYIALVVGAFLIYNTISVSVVRRRPQIGITRALGASKHDVMAAFIGEAAVFGLLGASMGLPLARIMASGAVRLMGTTVQALYVTSQPAAIEFTATSVFLALTLGIAVAVASAYSPAREASSVPPVEAMARGRREYITQVHKQRDLAIALSLALIAAMASRLPAVAGKPMFGYIATLLLIAASTLAVPALVAVITRLSSLALKKLLGVEALLASRSLSASLLRTSVLVGALSTAIAMMTSVAIMVGSFRETVLLWMGDQLPADLYVRPAGDTAADRHPLISRELADKIARLPGVAAVDRLREYEISYEGMPAGLGSVELSVLRSYHNADFLSGRPTSDVLAELRNANAVIVSEPFANKHHVRAGDSIILPLGETRAAFRIADVYYDYSSERGSIIMDRNVALRYLPDPTPSNLTIYLAAGAQLETVRAEIWQAASGHRILIFSNRDIRSEALQIFDRTFAITYALEAIAVIVAIMGVAGALLALVINRRRELGLLRFLGAAAVQVRKIILVEAGLIGLLSTLAGVTLGFFLSLILIFVINKQSFGWTIRFHWPIAILLEALTIVYLATVLSAFYPAWVAVRLNPVEVVHED